MREPGTTVLAPTPGAEDDRWRLRRLTTWAWPMLWGLVTGVGTFLLILPAGLFNDDLVNLQQHRARTLGDLLLEPVFFTQVSPGHRLLTELQLAVGPADRIVMHALIAALAAACVVLGARIVAMVARPSWWVPLLLTAILAGPAGIGTNIWYAAAYHVMPALTAGLLAVVLYLRWRGTAVDRMPEGRPIGALVAMAVGLLFSIKVVLAVVLIVLVEYVLVRRGDLETVVVGLWKERRVWIPFALTAGAYWFLTSRAGLDPSLGDAASTIEATWRGLVYISAPMLLGLAPAQESMVQGAPQDTPWVAWVVVAVLAAVVTRVGDLARRGLVVGLVVLAAGVGMSALVRIPTFGLNAALTPRYHVDGLVYLVVAVGIGVVVERTAVDTGTPGRPWVRRSVAGVAALGAVGVLTAAVVSDLRLVADSDLVESGEWTDAAAASLEETGPNPQLLDTPLPEPMAPAFPWWRTKELDGLLPGFAVTPFSPDSVATSTGEIEPLRVNSIFRQTGAEYSTNALVNVGEDATVRGDALCTRSWMTADLVLAPHPEPRYIELTLRGASDVRIDYVPHLGRFAEPFSEAVTGPGETTVVLPMDLLGWVGRVDLDVRTVEGENQACLTQVRFLEVLNDIPRSDELGA